MLSGAGIVDEFWKEVVDTPCYLVNISPTSVLVDKTPPEVWSSKKPSLAHLGAFGCDAFMHISKEKRSKLDNKAEKYIFIGYKYGVKGYKMWNLVTRKTIYSRDVIFREVESTSRNEDGPKEKEPKKLELEMKNEGFESLEQEESSKSDDGVEPQTPVLRRSNRLRRKTKRYSPHDFYSNFVLSILMMSLERLEK